MVSYYHHRLNHWSEKGRVLGHSVLNLNMGVHCMLNVACPYGPLCGELLRHLRSLSQRLTFNNTTQPADPPPPPPGEPHLPLEMDVVEQHIHLRWINPSDVNTLKDRDSLKLRAILLLKSCLWVSGESLPAFSLNPIVGHKKQSVYFWGENINYGCVWLWKYLLPPAGT